MTAQQGHKYKLSPNREVLALESGDGIVKVAEIDNTQPWGLGRPEHVPAQFLSALPMRYYFGQTPA